MKKMWISICCLAIALLAHVAPAQSLEGEGEGARSYFNNGAKAFANNQLDPALEIVNEGIARHPESLWLPLLKEAIEREKQNQSGGSSQQQKQQEQEQQDQNNQDQQPPPEQPEQKPEEQPEEEKDQKNDGEPDEPQDEKEPQQQPVEAEDMTEEEAEMVLDSLRQLEEAQREQMTQEIIKRKMRNLPPVEKDW